MVGTFMNIHFGELEEKGIGELEETEYVIK